MAARAGGQARQRLLALGAVATCMWILEWHVRIRVGDGLGVAVDVQHAADQNLGPAQNADQNLALAKR